MNEFSNIEERWDLVRPRALTQKSEPQERAPRLTTLVGTRGAFLDNTKDNARPLLVAIAELMRAEAGTAESTFMSKMLHTRFASAADLETAATYDFVIAAVGD